jgi:hypothetical protein
VCPGGNLIVSEMAGSQEIGILHFVLLGVMFLIGGRSYLGFPVVIGIVFQGLT